MSFIIFLFPILIYLSPYSIFCSLLSLHLIFSDMIISWKDPEFSTELALSFQETSGCSHIWQYQIQPLFVCLLYLHCSLLAFSLFSFQISGLHCSVLIWDNFLFRDHICSVRRNFSSLDRKYFHNSLYDLCSPQQSLFILIISL